MFTYRGGNMAGNGTYWDITSGLRIDMESEDILPGEGKTRYLKIPPIGMLLLAPIMGIAYFLLLPLMGIVTFAVMVVRKAFGGMSSLGKDIISFGWHPSEAYLAGKKKKRVNGRKAGQ